MDDILRAVSTVGFPIAITVYLLLRFEKSIGTELRELRNAVQRLTITLLKKGVDLNDE